ncbi:MAG: ribonuclease E/G [Pikeienuella sp.]|uniref:Rne/Rng family ribonuclease n=1 Tax=Pikeienuella sp. TaxID=2831957 RepID=UPI00391D056A
MAKKMLIDATHPEETRVVVMDGTRVDDFDFESINKRQLAGNIYLAKVTRVEPSLQAAFVEYGGNRHGFLAFSEIHPDYYQIPVADREALVAAEAAAQADDDAEAEERADGSRGKSRSRRSPRSRSRRKPGEGAEAGASEAGAADETADPRDDAEDPRGPEPEAAPEAGPDDEIAEDAGSDSGESVTELRRADEGDSRDEVESVGAESVEDEVRPRRMPTRRYKIQEVVKVRQIMLVQVVKEERGNKGAALTTYLSLAGRYCVLMPNTARGGGISRKITQAADRQKLKEIAGELEVPKGMGLIVRTAGAKRTKTEIRRDYEFLLRQWDQVRELTLKSIAPALIYEEGSLIKRSIRDLYGREIDTIVVDGEEAYREAKDYMKMLMPSHAKNVQLHRETTPLFVKHQVESHLSAMFNPTVQLKSGGYIVIGVTEALVAIDVNSGRSTREHSIEETALKTNLEAADEIARQLRLRDLAGLIVIDFIDMDEGRNNRAVEKRIKDRLKDDRARIQIGRISAFGLMEMSRQRLRPGMIEATTAPCPHCHGTGIVRSADNVALAILREVEEEGVRARSREVRVAAPVAIANFLVNQKRAHVAAIEARYGLDLLIEADPSLVSPDYKIEKIKGAVKPRPEAAPRVSAESAWEAPDEDEEIEDEEEAAAAPERAGSPKAEERREGGESSESKRRRRGKRGGRKRRKGDGDDRRETGGETGDEAGGEAAEAEAPAAGALAEPIDVTDGEAEADLVVPTPDESAQKPKRARPTPKPRAPKKAPAEAAPAEAAEPEPVVEAAEAPAEAVAEEPAPKPKPKPRSRAKKPKAEAAAESPAPEAAAEPAAAAAEPEPAKAAEPEAQPEPGPAAAAAEPSPEAEAPAPVPDEPAKPKRRGWWS